jgi:hypothetical protein
LANLIDLYLEGFYRIEIYKIKKISIMRG